MLRLAVAIILTLLLSPLPARAELWRCHQADGSDLFTDQVADPRMCRKYEAGADVSVVPDSSASAFAQQDAPMQGRPAFTQQELDQILAPIALYPDSLLSQILMAATYPLEVVEAARWSKANPDLTGDQAVRAVEQNTWDPSVKSIVAFPQILTMMDEKLDWMHRLGDAFLAQQAQVMDTVQNLRQRAYDAGNLKTTDQVRVEQQGQAIVVEPSNPQVIYVPYYDPAVIYGPWWWPAYRPIYWAPWPGYFVRPGFFVGFTWGLGIAVGERFFFGACDWPRRHVTVNNFRFNNTLPTNRSQVWRHNPLHRRNVPFRDASWRQQFGRTSAAPEARREFRGPDPSVWSGRREFGNRPVVGGMPGGRREMQINPSRLPVPDAGCFGACSVQTLPSAPSGDSPSRFGSQRPHEPRPHIDRQPHASGGGGRGADIRAFSERGHASAQGSASRPSDNVHGGSGSSRSLRP